MPIYEYVCEQCGREFEELVSGEALPACPGCCSDKTRKLMSACRHSAGHNPGGYQGHAAPPTSSGGGCAGCAGGSCATCK